MRREITQGRQLGEVLSNGPNRRMMAAQGHIVPIVLFIGIGVAIWRNGETDLHVLWLDS
jgi:hypothetical protein